MTLCIRKQLNYRINKQRSSDYHHAKSGKYHLQCHIYYSNYYVTFIAEIFCCIRFGSRGWWPAGVPPTASSRDTCQVSERACGQRGRAAAPSDQHPTVTGATSQWASTARGPRAWLSLPNMDSAREKSLLPDSRLKSHVFMVFLPLFVNSVKTVSFIHLFSQQECSSWHTAGVCPECLCPSQIQILEA